jgi:hypothetical protein
MNLNHKLMKHLIVILLLTTFNSILQAQTNYHEELRLLRTQYEDQQAKLKAQYGEAIKRLHNKVDKNTQPGHPARQAIKDELTKLGVKSDDDWYSGIWEVTIQSGRPLNFGFVIDAKSVTLYDLKANKPIKNRSTTDLAGQYKQHGEKSTRGSMAHSTSSANTLSIASRSASTFCLEDNGQT